ncbi:hypothetical protein [Pararhizobium mangrovi]|uniref:Glycosyltransferase RgtA/B/C/D-like domain-containing protein n=1 Tax=Pararhizobium mangrovi TaxID=2590452 RepID=A0A506U6M0_9HYPH|nr:hypothetical protein [Pararhizobium mangrovi]TPW28996.1 hypothetical protein FJU11_08430 [Pararhizobium mangrovi]
MYQTLKRTAGLTFDRAAWAIPVASALLGVFVFVRLMNFELRQDEQLYVPPVDLLDHHALYRDFFYNQVPGSAWWFYAVRHLFGTHDLLLSARLGVLFVWIALAGGICLVSYLLVRNWLFAFCAVVLTCANELFLNQTGMAATNNLLPLPFALIGTGLFIHGACRGRVRPLVLFVAGVSLALAVCFKISAVAFVPAVGIAAFLVPKTLPARQRLRMVVAPLLVGGIVGAIPILVYLIAEPKLFLAHVLGYHTGAHIGYWTAHGQEGGGVALSALAKIRLAWSVWFSGAVPVAIAAVLALVFVQRQFDRTFSRLPRASAASMVLAASTVLAMAVGFLPTPGFPQYYALALVSLPLALALAFSALAPFERRQGLGVLVAATVVVVVCAVPRFAEFLPLTLHPDKWTVTKVHRHGIAIRQALSEHGLSGKIATLAPIYPLEASLPVYMELATGPFIYRSAEFVDPGMIRYYRTTSPATVGSLFEKDPPAALLLGFDPVLERPLRDYAVRHGYVQDPSVDFTDRYGTAQLFVRPQ